MKTIYRYIQLLGWMVVMLLLFQNGWAQITDEPQQQPALQDRFQIKELTPEQKEVLRQENEARIKKYAELYKEAVKLAKERGLPLEIVHEDGSKTRLIYFEYGQPVYESMDNLEVAHTSLIDSVQQILGLTGEGEVVGLWDGARTRETHVEFNDGTGSRIVGKDGASWGGHATLTGGTIGAEGDNPQAKGMAPKVTIHSYNSGGDLGEMGTAALDDELKVSNHSYGPNAGWQNSGSQWYGNGGTNAQESQTFGKYTQKAADLDEMANDYPYYLICKSAGNHRNDNGSGTHGHNGGAQNQNDSHPVDCLGGSANNLAGYDCIPGFGNAKNIMVVGATLRVDGEYSGPGDVNMTSFSGWGPTDDGRIKPDIVANGQNVITPNNQGDNTYSSGANGTSLSSPAIAGGAALLLELQRDLYGQIVYRSSTLKGLILHTAYEAGPGDGPDYKFGWGLANFYAAALLMQEDADNGCANISELVINDSEELSFDITKTSTDKFLKVTICWIDPEGTVHSSAVDPSGVQDLVHDLDIRITHQSSGDVFYPWILDPANPNLAADTGDNSIDNVEQIQVDSTVTGTFTVNISHKGTIASSGQVVSVIISGMDVTPASVYATLSGTYNSATPVTVSAKSIVESIGATLVESPGDVTAEAGDFVRLNEGFHVDAAGEFNARILSTLGGCSTVQVMKSEPPITAGVISEDQVIEFMEKPIIYPNPTAGLFTIKWEIQNPTDAVISINNYLGQEVYREEALIIGKHDLNLAQLSAGVYLVKVDMNGTTFTEKLVLTD